MGQPQGEYIEGEGGRIFTRSWKPAGKPKAIVAICHGVNAHSGYFKWAGEQFAANGYAAYALDLRGRGQSDGERFYIKHVSEYANDVAALIRHAKAREGALPVFLLGHSAGGVTSCIYTLDHQDQLKGFICESFAFQLPAPDFALAALKGLAHVAPHAHVLKLNNAHFSRDPAAVKAMNDDPLIDNEAQPTATVAALAIADDRIRAEFSKFQLPLLIMHGTKDHATKHEGSEEFYAKAGSKDKTLKLYEGYYHDLLNDTGKEQPMADILGWIEARL